MKNWLTHLFAHSNPAPAPVSTTPEWLALQTELQALRLELASRESSLANLKLEVERLRARQEQTVADTVTTQMQGLFTDMAAPASQILTQADLLENQAKPIQAADILAVARRMVRALERHGLVFDGQPGQAASFDPNRHTPMSAARVPQPGDPITIRFAGATYQDRIISKAIVE